MNVIFKVQKLNFSFVPKIKFLGKRRGIPVAFTSSIKGEAASLENTQKFDNIQSKGESNHYSLLNKEVPRSLGTFYKSFNNLTTDLDIPRDVINEKEIETVNLAYVEIDDWRKIKYN
jgi:hypothetical protein